MKRVGWLLTICMGTQTLLQAQTGDADVYRKVDTGIISLNTGYRNIGFGSQPAKQVTSAISVVHGDAINQNYNLNPGSALFGRLAGVTVTQAGAEPGAAVPSLFIRGRNTFGDAGTAPLYVIDGYISNGSATSNSFMQLVPEEIESITVLKDASATAIYGSRGANGVVLVTTKTGNKGPLKVNFSTRQGVQKPQKLPQFLNAYDYARLYNEALANDGLAAKYTDADLTAYQTGSDPIFHPVVNWYDEVLRPGAYASDYDLNLNGGDDNVKYYVMLNALLDQGLFKKFGKLDEQSSNSFYSRYNFRTNLDIKLSKRLSTEFKIAGSIEEIRNPNGYNTGSTFSLLALLPPNAFPVYNPNGSYGGNSTYSNPLANLRSTGFYKQNARTVLTSLKFTEQLDMITPGLSGSGSISINSYFKSGSYKSKSYQRFFLTKNTNGDTVYNVIGNTTSLAGTEQTLDQYRNIIIQAFLNYHRTFNKSDVSGMLMFNRDEITLFGPAGDPTTPTGNSTDAYKHNNGSGRFTYAYNDKYILEASGSYMGSNIFPKGGRYGFFPAGSAGWVASNESFLKNNKAINFLKLRGSYGLVGNDVIVPLGLSTRYSLYTQTFGGGSYIFGTGNVNSGGTAEALLANPNITWEKEKQANIGLDVTLFKNFDVTVDFFKRDRSDIIVATSSTIPQYLGAITPFANQGKSETKGVDGTIRYRSSDKKLLRFFVEGEVTYSKNKIVFNAEALQINTGRYLTGTTIGQPFGYQAIGFFTQAEIDARILNPKAYPAPLTETIKAGDVKYKDIGGPAGVPDGIIDANDVSAIGHSSLPDLIAGLHGGLSYKGFDLDFVFQAVTDNTIYLGGSYFEAFQNNGQISPLALGRWTPQTAATATYPRLTTKTNNQNNFLFSTLYQRDGRFLKLRSAEIGYTIPVKLTQRVKLNTIRIFAQGTNLFSLDKISYGDPESLTGYPVLRTIMGGVRIKI